MATSLLQKKKLWTYDDYRGLPDDLNIYEIIEGALYVTPAPTPKHQKVSLNLAFHLKRYLEDHPIGEIYEAPVDVLLDPQTVVQPDILFISNDRLSIVKEKNIQGPPDLVVEISSPGTIQKDRILKVRTYARSGIRHLWIIDPDNLTLEAFTLDNQVYRLVECLAGDEEFRPPLFPDMILPLKKVWG